MKCEICEKEILRDSQCINYKYYHNDCIENLEQKCKKQKEVIDNIKKCFDDGRFEDGCDCLIIEKYIDSYFKRGVKMNTYSEDKMYESYSGEVERMQKCIDELLQENKKLKDNWNKLKEFIVESNKTLCWTNNYDSILGKMEELQGSDNNDTNR